MPRVVKDVHHYYPVTIDKLPLLAEHGQQASFTPHLPRFAPAESDIEAKGNRSQSINSSHPSRVALLGDVSPGSGGSDDAKS